MVQKDSKFVPQIKSETYILKKRTFSFLRYHEHVKMDNAVHGNNASIT